MYWHAPKWIGLFDLQDNFTSHLQCQSSWAHRSITLSLQVVLVSAHCHFPLRWSHQKGLMIQMKPLYHCLQAYYHTPCLRFQWHWTQLQLASNLLAIVLHNKWVIWNDNTPFELHVLWCKLLVTRTRVHLNYFSFIFSCNLYNTS